MFLNIIKCSTQKLRGKVSTNYFTIRKDGPDQGIRQVPDDNWHPAEKSVHGLGPQTKLHGQDRPGYGGSCNSGRGQVQELLPEISSHGSDLVSLPPELPGSFSQSHQKEEVLPQLHRVKVGSELRQTKLQHGAGFAQGPSSTVVYMQTCYCCEGFSTSARSFYLSASSPLQMWSKLLGNCRRVGGMWGIN